MAYGLDAAFVRSPDDLHFTHAHELLGFSDWHAERRHTISLLLQ